MQGNPRVHAGELPRHDVQSHEMSSRRSAAHPRSGVDKDSCLASADLLVRTLEPGVLWWLAVNRSSTSGGYAPRASRERQALARRCSHTTAVP